MNNTKLKAILLDQKEVFNRRTNLVQRDIDMAPYLKTSQIVVISGVRRCGKSALLYLMKEALELQEEEYLFFNFDDERIIANLELLDGMYSLHIELYNKEPIFFLDEIQNVKGWEKFVNRMYERGLKLYITGSNANLLSSEIATSLTGRNKVIRLFPFSFREYLRLRNREYKFPNLSSRDQSLIQRDLNGYMEWGGFPLVIEEADLEIIQSYFQDILYRDIVVRFNIKQVDEIRQIALFLLSNTGKLFSNSRLQQLSHIKSSSTVKRYLDYLEDAFLFIYIKKFDFSIRKQIANSRKVYPIDTAFSNRLGFHFSENKGRQLESIVLLELLRQGFEVFYHQGKRECDFIVREGNNVIMAIQVCYHLDKSNVIREVSGLSEAMDAYHLESGLLITSNGSETDIALPSGVHLKAAPDFLLEKISL